MKYANGALKRSIDLTVAGLSLVVLSPVLAITAIAVRLRLGSPVFFKHPRPGMHGKTFTLLKFRTMRDATDASGNPLPDPERLTAFGRLLRSTSLDELPELLNVLQGTMSLIGPRPLLMDYLPLYSPEQARRHEVRPGITGWAQVNGRNSLSWDDKFRLDVWYVDHATLWLDLKIVVRTFAEIIGRQGITSPDRDYVERFVGSSGSRRDGAA